MGISVLSGFLIKPNKDELIEKILICLGNLKIKNSFYMINKELVSKKGDWNKNAKKIEAIYNYLLKKKHE